jgi:hypothetical protein
MTMPRLNGTIEGGAQAFVQLRDEGGDFVGEVRADDAGHFVFYAIPGHWRVICLAPGGRRVEHEVDMGSSDVDVDLDLTIAV